jgi:hypothetical protein
MVEVFRAGQMKKMEYKKISRQELSEKATTIINAPYTATDELFYQSTEWINTRDEYFKNKPFCELCFNKGKTKRVMMSTI